MVFQSLCGIIITEFENFKNPGFLTKFKRGFAFIPFPSGEERARVELTVK